jgi:hypothetical protein
MIGSVIAKYLVGFGKNLVENYFNLETELNERYSASFEALKRDFQEFRVRIDKYFQNINDLMAFAFSFDVNANLALQVSIQLTRKI